MKKLGGWLVVGMVVGLVGFAMLGCETTETADNALSITPSSIALTNVNDTVTFTVGSGGTNATLALPLIWTVSDNSLGTIKSSAGLAAIYESKGKVGNNTITVRDQGQAEGLAVVNQR